MSLVINELGEFIDDFDPNPDEQRMRAYESIRRLDPRELRVRDVEKKERKKER